jgi:hypothetical protein
MEPAWRAIFGWKIGGATTVAAIVSFLKEEPAFDPADVKAMSMAFDDVCKALRLNGDKRATETVAVRIVELARRGERSPTKLRDRVLAEANGVT